jgi:hypothetical protein
MKFLFSFLFASSLWLSVLGNNPLPGYEFRLRSYIDSLHVVDTHEHMFDPEGLRNTYFLDFTLLLQQNSLDDLYSAGMPDSLYDYLFNKPLPAEEKWQLMEPYWERTFNTSSNRVIMRALNDIYGISELDDSTVTRLSAKMKEVYGVDWFNYVMKDLCKFDYVLQESDGLDQKSDFVRYTEKFTDWLTVKSKYTIDSIAAMCLEPVSTLGDFVNCQKHAFENAVSIGMVAVKINISYARTISIADVSYKDANKVFCALKKGDMSFKISNEEAKPLQDYMIRQLISLAREYKLPVAFHTGLQAGSGNYIENSDPSLLTNLFLEYPDVKFVLYHGSYPFGGKLSALAKNFRNVFLDMNWTYSISPSYAAGYLDEWLETVPASKIMAFGGDQRCVENTYGELKIAKKIISDVLIAKVRNGYLNEKEAMDVARMILRDNAVNFYGLK